MAFLKNISGGKKQAPVPGPNSAAFKKILAAKKSKSVSSNGGKKKPKANAAFSSLKSRQMLVERVKREIWASVVKINDAIISLAMAGNFQAAKALFDFAGVYSLPEPEKENASAAPVPSAFASPSASDDAPEPIEAFFRSIGVQPPNAQPEPGALAAG
jgi:hypothetical protein